MDLMEVLERYGVKLKKKGLDWWASCPFHEDRRPSFSVTKKGDDYLWWCFSCKSGGKAVEFIQQFEHVSREQALKLYSILSGEEYEYDEDRVLLTSIIESLPLASLDYRGISARAVKDYGIRYCANWGSVIDGFGLSIDSARELGLVDLSDSFVYPYVDAGGVFAIQARAKSKKAFQSPKGRFWRRSLWGLDHLKSDKTYIFEGPNDVLTAYDHGIAAIAMCGTTMQEEDWAELRSRRIKQVTFVPDGDAGGRGFLERMIGNYPDDFEIMFVELPSGDPDDWIKKEEFDFKPQYPIVWYVESREKSLSTLKSVAKVFHRLPVMERAFFRNYLIETYGEDLSPYLYVEIEPDLEAEKVVLANCIFSKFILDETMHALDEGCFHGERHRNAWLKAREGASQTMLKSVGIDFSSYVDPVNYKKYVDRVKQVRTREQIAGAYRTFCQDGEIGKLVEQVYKSSVDELQIAGGADVVRSVIRRLDDAVNNPEVRGIPLSGRFPVLNTTLLGWVPTKLILLLGNTGHGKTTLACNFISDLISMGETPLFVSLEMSPEEIVEKLLTIRTGVQTVKMITGSVDQEEYDKIVAESKEMMADNLRIVHGIYGLHQIVGVIKSQVIKYGVKVVFLDYLQLIQVSSKQDRWEQLMTISSVLKRLCNATGVTCVMLSQLGRGSLNAAVPEASYNFGSYGVIADSDVAITVAKREASEDGNFLIYVDKHRYNVDNVIIKSVFDRSTQRIREVGS